MSVNLASMENSLIQLLTLWDNALNEGRVDAELAATLDIPIVRDLVMAAASSHLTVLVGDEAQQGLGWVDVLGVRVISEGPQGWPSHFRAPQIGDHSLHFVMFNSLG